MARKGKSEKRQATQFAWILAALLAGIAGFAFWRNHTIRAVACSAAAISAISLSLVAPAIWLRFFRLWMKLAEGMSWVMTRVILSVFFYLILAPVGLVLRLTRKDLLNLAWKDGRTTYWIDKAEGEYSFERYEKQY